MSAKIREEEIECFDEEMQWKIHKKAECRRIHSDRIKIQEFAKEVTVESSSLLRELDNRLLERELSIQKEITADGTNFNDIPDIEYE